MGACNLSTSDDVKAYVSVSILVCFPFSVSFSGQDQPSMPLRAVELQQEPRDVLRIVDQNLFISKVFVRGVLYADCV